MDFKQWWKDGEVQLTEELYAPVDIAEAAFDAALTDANERIRVMEGLLAKATIGMANYEVALTAEREVSDKLEKALIEAVDEIEGMSGQDMSCDPKIVCDDFRELIATVAAIRKGEKQ